jgi:hypothetical protein
MAMITLPDYEYDRWIDRLGWAGVELTGIVFVCLIAFSIIAIRNRQSAIGVVLIAMGVLCCPGLLFGLPLGLIYGWSKSRSWGIQTFMVFWTALSVLAVANWIGYGFVRFFTRISN